jgi:hypothetical protein
MSAETIAKPYKILVLSDLHLRSPESDQRYQKFLDVLKKFEESSYDELFLMGDVFDILIGPFQFWKRLHPDFFTLLHSIKKNKKNISWVQGNHDFQIGSLLQEFKINWIEQDVVLERNQLKIYLAHGDLADWTDKLHPLWRKLLTSQFLKWILGQLSENFAEKRFYPFALKASSASRRVSGTPEKNSKTDETFKKYALKMGTQNKASLVLLGHSHLTENTLLDQTIHYLNIGSWLNEELIGSIEIQTSGQFETKVFPVETWLSA